MWTGVRYSVTSRVDVVAAYYHYIQDSYFGTARGTMPCSGAEHAQCAGTYDAVSGLIDWKFAPKWDLYVGLMYNKVNGGLANGFIQRNNIDPSVGVRFRY
jgi:predicted porin